MTLALVERPTEKLSPLERLEALCDPGSLSLIRSDVLSARMGERARSGDGVVGGSGRVDGRPVFCYAQDPSYAGGSLGEAHADTIVRILRLAGRSGVPVVGFVESAGARLQEGLAALGGYGRIFGEHVRLSGRVPQITVITGASAGGGSYAPALNDFVVMTEAATMFLTGPGVVSEVMGEALTAAELGGPRVHARNGVSHFTASTDVDAALLVRDLLDYLPQRAGERPARWPAQAPGGERPDLAVPDDERRVYDVRSVIADLVDGGRMLEFAPRWARNLVCAFARLDGAPLSSIAIATNKAWSAARERKPTKEIGQAARQLDKGFDIGYFGDPKFTGWGGGVPVWNEGRVIGSVAVSATLVPWLKRLAPEKGRAVQTGSVLVRQSRAGSGAVSLSVKVGLGGFTGVPPRFLTVPWSVVTWPCSWPPKCFASSRSRPRSCPLATASR